MIKRFGSDEGDGIGSMGLGRRTFLERMLSAGLGIACGEALSLRYAQVLAQDAPRKLALLVGINQYRSASGNGCQLLGCLTDLDLQRELLIHRFGFAPADIVTLTDQQASRSAVEAVFLEHLVGAARPGDVVVFHFSGLGSRLLPPGAPTDGFEPTGQDTLVMANSEAIGDGTTDTDLAMDTLLLLLRSLATDQVITVLDTCHTPPSAELLSGAGLLGHWRVRARPGRRLLAEQELALQERLRARLGLAPEQLGVQRRSGQLAGLVVSAGGTGAWALDGLWQGYSAGLLTRLLTQQLWQTTPATTLQVVLGRINASAQSRSRHEQPQLQGQKSSQLALKPYLGNSNLGKPAIWGADGAITSVEENGRAGRLWLGGLPPAVLDAYAPGSVLTIASAGSETAALPPTQLQVRSRNGLNAQGRLLDEEGAVCLRVGQRLHEQWRSLPRSLGLAVALDRTLSRIERVDATSALAALEQMQAVQAGEQPADCLFSRCRAADQAALAATSASLPPVDSYGLFSSGRDPVLGSFGEVGESVGAAIRRLGPRLQSLLALKLLRLAENSGSSRLGVAASLALLNPGQAGEPEVGPRPLGSQTTTRATEAVELAELAAPPTAGVLALPVGASLQVRLHSREHRPLYGCVLALSALSKGSIRVPGPLPAGPEAAAGAWAELPAQAVRSVPCSGEPMPWIVREPRGLVEVAAVFSQTPLEHIYQNLKAAIRQPGAAQTLSQEMLTLQNPLALVQALLQDLEQASAVTPRPTGLPEDALALEVNAWACLIFTCRVV